MRTLIIVFLGGGLGSVTRYLLGRWINLLHNYHFPWGTLGVNVMACLVLGIVVGLADHRQVLSPGVRLFLVVGFCGGFSTFSTFSNEALELLQGGFTLSLFSYIISSLILCIGTTYTGIYIGLHN